MNKKPVDIIILSYNVKNKLKRCINSVRKFTKGWDYLITVIDNGSRDGTKRFLRSQKDLNIIYNNSNLGFAKARNLAFRKTKNELIVCLDDDIKVTKNWLDGLYKEMVNKKKVGIVGPRVLFPNLNFQFSAFLIANKKININKIFRGRYLKVQEVDGVYGACWLIKRELLRNVGYFDEQFWCGYEDIDYCLRVRLAGYKIIYTTQATVSHHHLFRYKVSDNFEKFLKKWPDVSTISLTDDNIVNKSKIKARKYLTGGYYDKALIEFKNVSKPYRDGNLLLTIDYCLYKIGKNKEPVGLFKKMLKYRLSKQVAYYSLGLCYNEKNRYQQAMAVFKKAIRIQPKFYPAYNSLGAVYFETGKIKRSINEFKKAIKINPVFQDAHYNLGVSYQQLGKYKEAIKSYKKALEINPKDKEAKDNLKTIINE